MSIRHSPVLQPRGSPLLAFARTGHILFGSDWPFAPTPAGQYFANGLDSGVDATMLEAVNHLNAGLLFPRLASGPRPSTRTAPASIRLRQSAQR